jgi:hypothetical protein
MTTIAGCVLEATNFKKIIQSSKQEEIQLPENLMRTIDITVTIEASR